MTTDIISIVPTPAAIIEAETLATVPITPLPPIRTEIKTAIPIITIEAALKMSFPILNIKLNKINIISIGKNSAAMSASIPKTNTNIIKTSLTEPDVKITCNIHYISNA